MADEEIRLILDVKGGAAVRDLRENLDYTRATLAQLKAAYEAGQVSTEDYLKTGGRLERQAQSLASTIAAVDAEQARLNADLLKALAGYDAVDAAMEELEQSSTRAAASMRKVGDAAGETKSKAAGLSQTALEFSRGIEDFSTGGFIGILNNIPGMFRGIGAALGLAAGPLAAFTAGVSLLATGAYVLYKNWDSVLGMFETRNAIPEATTSLERHEEALKKVNKSLDDMKERTSLNYDELKKFKELQQEQADLEEKVAQDRKTKANEQAHGEHASQAEKDTTSGFAKALDEAGGYKLVVDRFTDQLANQLKATESQIPGLRAAIEKQFNDALAGDMKAINTIRDTAAKDTTGRTGMFDTFIDMHSPQTKAKEKKAEQSQALIEEFEAPDLGDKALADQKKKAKQEQDALVDRLNKQGKEGEAEALKANREMLAAQAKDTKEGKATIVKEATGADKATEARAKGMKGLELEAQGLIGQHLQNGGSLDANGQLSTADFDRLRGMIGDALRRQNPGMKPLDRSALASKIASNAEQALNQKLVNAQSQSGNNVQALIGVAGQLDAEVARLRQQAGMQAMEIQKIRRNGQARARGNTKTGG